MMMSFHCGEVWETRRVFQGAVVKSKTCPWSRRLSAVARNEREFTPLPVSKPLTRSEIHGCGLDEAAWLGNQVRNRGSQKHMARGIGLI